MNDISNSNGDDRYNRDQSKSLKIAETNSKFVGKGMALVDPKVMEMMKLTPGDVIEVNKKNKSTYVLLWSSPASDYGKGLIRIDGYTRSNIGEGIDDRVTVRKVDNIEKANS
jgi:transitional endoplasmic reticulum ATPase